MKILATLLGRSWEHFGSARLGKLRDFAISGNFPSLGGGVRLAAAAS